MFVPVSNGRVVSSRTKGEPDKGSPAKVQHLPRSCRRLEIQPQRELDLACGLGGQREQEIDGARDSSSGAAVHTAIGQVKVDVVKGIERLHPELALEPLRHCEVLEK